MTLRKNRVENCGVVNNDFHYQSMARPEDVPRIEFIA